MIFQYEKGENKLSKSHFLRRMEETLISKTKRPQLLCTGEPVGIRRKNELVKDGFIFLIPFSLSAAFKLCTGSIHQKRSRGPGLHGAKGSDPLWCTGKQQRAAEAPHIFPSSELPPIRLGHYPLYHS